MAKCSICNSRKGKRKCLVSNTMICSPCCGESRNEDICLDCSYFQKPKRKYNEVPKFTTSEMSNNDQLSAYSNVIEGALCSYDIELEKSLQDNDAIAILEMLLDKYHFSDENIENKSPTLISGFNYIEKAIQKDLSDIDREILVKIIGVIRFVANRRTKTGREYMNIIHQFVGQRIDTGVRVLSNFSA
ncbi:hypothetical protein [uncultured Desulfobacter sp.]|uniref:hypothetical protein n=1 Tax=uncultured Desulfobacter sp. TaxID=240139 RepID=UPI002AAC22BB|nr:hypothetical protein [uncultured Desulfobacter sp.]